MNDSMDVIRQCMAEHGRLLEEMPALAPDMGRAADIITARFRAGGRVLLCGNGGSAADAQHIAAEFSGRFLREREPWDAMALTVNTSVLTAVGNDYAFDEVFARQVRAHGRAGDILVGISTSGNSGNVLRAAEAARELGMSVIGMTGQGGGRMAGLCEVLLAVHSSATPRIQEMHILMGHIICQIVEEALCSTRP